MCTNITQLTYDLLGVTSQKVVKINKMHTVVMILFVFKSLTTK